MTNYPRVSVIGIEADGTIMPTGREILREAEVLLGWDRHLELLEPKLKENSRLIESLEDCIPRIEDYDSDDSVAVLSTGDPLYYGVGAYLVERLPRERLTFIPARSSVQLAYAALGEPYAGASVHSLHGRPLDSLRTPLSKSPDSVALFTEPDGNTPRRIFEFLESIGCDHYEFFLFQRLTGNDEPERIETSNEVPVDVDPLNLVILSRKEGLEPTTGPRPGLRDEFFRGEDDSMVSRSEVRMISLHWLEVEDGDTVWEIGAATGSVSLESARLNPAARYYALERRENRYETLRRNRRELESYNVIPIKGEAPEEFDELPPPDRVFLGGSGGRLADILSELDTILTPGDVLVATFITLGNFNRTRRFFQDSPYELTLKQVVIHEDRKFGRGYTRWDPGPCIYFLRARRQSQ